MTHQTFKAQLQAFFFEHADTWIPRAQIARLGGDGGYRQRISDCRREGLVIECRERRVTVRGRSVKRTDYRYLSPRRRQARAA